MMGFNDMEGKGKPDNHVKNWPDVLARAERTRLERLAAVRQAQRGNGPAAAHAAVEQVMGNDGLDDYTAMCIDLLGQD